MQFEELGRYEILEERGRNPVGRVLLARDPVSGATVSIQLVETLADIPADRRSAAVQRLVREAHVLAALEHPGIVAVHDAGEARDLAYLVTDHVEGTPLAVYCRPDSLLPVAKVLQFGAEVASGLEVVHRAGLVHGSLEPGALIRVEENTVKVAGFALAPFLPLDEAGTLRGTPGYLAPEQIRGEPAESGSDVFALGAVLYEMLSGRKAFPGDSLSTILYRTVNEEVSDPREFDPPVSQEAARALLLALAKQPDRRYADAGRFAEALHDADVALRIDESIVPELPGSDGVASAPATSGAPARRSERRSSLRPFLLGTLLVALVLVAGLSALRSWLGQATAPAEPTTLETRVRTEPPGLDVRLDGVPVAIGEEGRLRFPGVAPFGVLTASQACRTAEHPLDPADAGGEVVLVVDPIEVEVPLEPDVDGARVLVNGDKAGTTPAAVKLDLCRANRLELRAEGYRTASVEIPAGVPPLEARTLAYSLALEPVPRGRLVLPRSKRLQLVYYVNGKRQKASTRELDLDEGEYELRYKNEYHWIDQRIKLRIEGGGTVNPPIDPRLATLAVQAFPSNCKVYLRRPGGSWRYLDETPAERKVATGRYEVKVQLNPTGETRISKVELEEGINPPVRVAFGRSR